MKSFHFTFFVIFMLLVGQLPAQPDAAVLRQTAMDESRVDTNRLWALDSLALMVFQNQPDSSLLYAQRQLDLATSLDNKRWMAIGEQNMGIAYYLKGDLTNALKHYEKSLKWMRETGNKRGVAGMLINIGTQYGGQGNFTLSQKYTLEALTIAEEIGDKEFQANALGRLGSINYQNGNTEEAKDYFLRAYRINEESGSKRGLLASSLVNLGIFYAEEGEYEEALSYTLRAADVFEELNGKYGLADAYSNLGYIYGNTGESEKQLKYYEKALEIEREIGNEYGESGLLTYIGEAYLERKEYARAIDYLSKAQALVKEIGDLKSQKDIARQLFLASKASGQYEAALENHERWVMMRDSLDQEEQSKELLKQQFQFEQEKKDALAKAALARQNLQRNASLLGLGLVGILAFVLFQNGRRRRKTNELLSFQKKEIERKNQQNELLLKEIHHRVKNNLQTISSLLYLQSAHIKDAEVKQAVSDGRHRVESMALIHQKLYQRENLAAIEMKDYLTNLGRSLLATLAHQSDRIQLDIDMDELELDVDTAIPLGLITNELLTNSLKYAFPDGRSGHVRMSLSRREDSKLELLVADDGVGAANKESGTSFGSQLIELLSVQIGGTLEQGDENGYWTRVVV